jgi:hypothetical protein
MVIHRVVEQKEPLRTVAAAYGVSHETIRRIVFHGQQEMQQLTESDSGKDLMTSS